MNIVDAFRRTGSYRAAAAICGVNHKTRPPRGGARAAGTVRANTGAQAPAQHRCGARADRGAGASDRRADLG